MADPIAHVSSTLAEMGNVSAAACDVQVEREAVVMDEVSESGDMTQVERQLEQLTLELNTGQQLDLEKQHSGR